MPAIEDDHGRPGEHDADVAPVTTPARPGSLEREYPGVAGSLRAARGEVTSWAKDAGLDGVPAETVSLVVSELAAQALQAAPGHAFGVVVYVNATHVVVQVHRSTAGDGPAPSSVRLFDAVARQEQSLAVVAALADEVEAVAQDDGVVTTARIAMHWR